LDRRRLELQIRTILVTYRIEQRRTDSQVMDEFRRRADAIMQGLEADADGDPELLVRISEARTAIREPDASEEPPR
jgi:hypothetical protein